MGPTELKRLFNGQRRALARAITLTESTNPDHRRAAAELLDACLPKSGQSLRIGISGVPGVGKSTFIETFGLFLISVGKKVGVLAVDPSSPTKGGSILGDKIRMENLSRNDKAFIRPSPARQSIGGVANHTRESILLAEAAGYNVILVETVGVGQSEYEVHSMTDLFLVLMQPGAGDELQGIKKGILELADFIVINKADGDAERLAKQSVVHYKSAMSYLNHQGFWTPEVLSVSSIKNHGIGYLWERMQDFCDKGYEAIPERRKNQASQWFDRLLNDGIAVLLKSNPAWTETHELLKERVARGDLSPPQAALSCLTEIQKLIDLNH